MSGSTATPASADHGRYEFDLLYEKAFDRLFSLGDEPAFLQVRHAAGSGGGYPRGPEWRLALSWIPAGSSKRTLRAVLRVAEPGSLSSQLGAIVAQQQGLDDDAIVARVTYTDRATDSGQCPALYRYLLHHGRAPLSTDLGIRKNFLTVIPDADEYDLRIFTNPSSAGERIDVRTQEGSPDAEWAEALKKIVERCLMAAKN